MRFEDDMIQEDQSKLVFWKKLVDGVTNVIFLVTTVLLFAFIFILFVFAVESFRVALLKIDEAADRQRACPVSCEQMKRADLRVELPWGGLKLEETKPSPTGQCAADAPSKIPQFDPSMLCGDPLPNDGLPIVEKTYEPFANNNQRPGCLNRKYHITDIDYAILYYNNTHDGGIFAMRVRLDAATNQQEMLGYGQLVPGTGTPGGILFVSAFTQHFGDSKEAYISLVYTIKSSHTVMTTICEITTPSAPDCSFRHRLYSLNDL